MCEKRKKRTRLSFFEKKEKSDRFRVLSQKGLLERILHKKSSHKSTHTERERESCCRYCFCVLFSRAERRTQRWCSQYGPSSQRCTTSFIQEQNNGGYDEWEKNRPTEERVPEPPEVKDEETETIRPTVAHIKSDHRAEV